METNQSSHGETECFSYSVQDRVAIVRLVRKVYELSSDLSLKHSFFATVAEAEESDDVRAILFLNSPECLTEEKYQDFLRRTFGRESEDEDGLNDRAGELMYSRQENMLHQFILQLIGSRKIVVSGLRGEIATPFVGASLASDFRFVSEKSKLLISMGLHGIPPCGGIGYFLPQFVGRAKAVEMLLTSKSLSPSEAFDYGLVNAVLPDEDFEAECVRKTSALATLPASAVACTRATLYSFSNELRKYLESEAKAMRVGCTAMAEERRRHDKQ